MRKKSEVILVSDERTNIQILIDIQNLCKITEDDIKRSMEGNIAAGKRARHAMSEVREWAFIIRQKIRLINGKYYSNKGKRQPGTIGLGLKEYRKNKKNNKDDEKTV